MDTIWTQLLLVAALVLLNAAFAGSEIALISLRQGQLNRLEQAGRTGQTLARLVRDPNLFLATIQIGITLAGFLASATAAVTLAEPLVEVFAPLGDLARPAAILVVTLLLTFVTLVIGELAPKRVAMQRAERWALVAARPIGILASVSRPAIWLLGRSTDVMVRLMGGDPALQREDVTEEELRDMVAVQPELSEEERAIIGGAFEFADRTLREILVPRPSVIALPADMPAAAAAERIVATGHSRAPVYGEGLDDVVGIVHLRSLVGASGAVRDHAQPALTLPETLGALDTLRTMQAKRQQMAIVISEHGGTEGLITMEDLIEELVGEIWDETDPDVRSVQRHPGGGVTVPGSYPIHDLPDIGVDLPAGDYTTVAGLLLDRLGRVPARGEELGIGGWSLQIEDATDRRVTRVRLTPAAAGPPESPAPPAPDEG